MKKVLILAALLIGTAGFAQGPRGHHRQGMDRMDFTPEQQATLHSKKLALALDLNEQQQGKVMALQLKRAEERKALMEAYKKDSGGEKQPPTSEERFNRLNAHLDRQLAYKSEMKKILSEEQYKKWNQMASHMRKSFREGRGSRFERHSKR